MTLAVQRLRSEQGRGVRGKGLKEAIALGDKSAQGRGTGGGSGRLGRATEKEKPAVRLHFQDDIQFHLQNFYMAKEWQQMVKWLYITLNHGHLEFTLFLPSSPLTAGRAEKPACSLARVVVGKSFQLHWPEDTQLFFPSLHVLLEKLRHNPTHYVHSEDEKECSCLLFILSYCYGNQHNSL